MANRLWNLVSKSGTQTSDGWTEDVEAGGRVGDREDVRRVLEACCQANAEALVLSFEDQAISRVRFLKLGDDVFRVSLEGDLPPQLRPPTQCTVSMQFGQRNRVFVATVLAVRPGEMSGGALELLLKVPGEMAAGDARMAFRVPILKPADLSVELHVNGTPVENARPLTLSLIGTLIEAPLANVQIPDDAEIRVVLHHGDTHVTLRAEVRRRFERGLALFFPDVLEEGSLEPPDDLRAIVRELERLWLRQRAR